MGGRQARPRIRGQVCLRGPKRQILPSPTTQVKSACSRSSGAGQPALLMFWRHFGCGSGVARAERLKTEYKDYLDAGLNPVIVAQGEPARAAAYRTEHGLACPVLCDPDHVAYRAYGIGQWAVERILSEGAAGVLEPPTRGRGELSERPARPGPPAGG